MRGAARRPPRPALLLQAPEPRRRVLARRREAADAAAHLRHRVLDQGGARRAPGLARGGQGSATTASSAPSSTSSARTRRPAAGFVFWHPNLGAVRREIEDFWWEEHTRARLRAGVHPARRARDSSSAVSGHLENYAEMMYAPMEIDEHAVPGQADELPGAHPDLPEPRRARYRELPLRWAELGTVYRYERSGVLHGMLRVRGFTQDDAHIFCTPEQLADEIAGVLRRSSTRSSRPSATSTPPTWRRARPRRRSATTRSGTARPRPCAARREIVNLPLELDEGGGAFYGPKIDYKMPRRARPRVAERHHPVRLQPARALRPASTPTPTARRSARSWCTAPSSAAWSASSAA